MSKRSEKLMREAQIKQALKYLRASLAWKKTIVAEVYARVELNAALGVNSKLDDKVAPIERSIPVLELTIAELERRR